MSKVNNGSWSGLVLAFLTACSSGAGTPQAAPKAQLQPRLPTGNYLDPAGTSLTLGSFPVAAVLSPERDRVVVLLNGWREEGIQVVDRATGQITQTLLQPAAFIGLEFSPDGKTLYASGGNQDVVYRYDWHDRMATLRDSIVLAMKDPKKDGTRYPAGLHVSRDGSTLYVAENLADSLAIVDVASGNVLQRVAAGRYPYGVAEDADGNVFVSSWGRSDVVVISPRSASQPSRVLATIPVARHPSAMTVSADGHTLYVASASTDRVSVVDTRARKSVGELHAPAGAAPEGSTPDALALSADGTQLYVAEADNNDVAVWNLAGNTMAGRIPVQWYPTAVVVAGDSLLVINGKGHGTGPNPDLPHPGTGTQNSNQRARLAYTLGQLNGSLTTLTHADRGNLAALTSRVAKANGWNAQRTQGVYPPFQHVVYIIKENRTYDQVFGDIAEADGDTSLVYFPRKVSPNHHALADRFGVFDRFFVNAEVSAQGHNWSTAAYSSDYLEKTVQPNYSGRGRSYDYEGENRGVVPSDVGEDDAAEPANGYFWDLAERGHITLRNFGEFVRPERKAAEITYRGIKPYLADNTDPQFAGFDLNIPDQRRADVFLDELQQYEHDGRMPQFIIMRLPNDHTAGARANAPTPRAYMADNDLALGRVVDGISHSKFWPNTVIFVLEDDAQNGPDHVDSHRSPILIISPYNKPGVNHRFANTSDVIATMADILHLGTLSQFDYYGRPLRDIFAKQADLRPYNVLKATWDMNEHNPGRGVGAIESRKLKLAQEDQSDDDLFNRILWRAIKGDAKPYPGAKRMPASAIHN